MGLVSWIIREFSSYALPAHATVSPALNAHNLQDIQGLRFAQLCTTRKYPQLKTCYISESRLHLPLQKVTDYFENGQKSDLIKISTDTFKRTYLLDFLLNLGFGLRLLPLQCAPSGPVTIVASLPFSDTLNWNSTSSFSSRLRKPGMSIIVCNEKNWNGNKYHQHFFFQFYRFSKQQNVTGDQAKWVWSCYDRFWYGITIKSKISFFTKFFFCKNP